MPVFVEFTENLIPSNLKHGRAHESIYCVTVGRTVPLRRTRPLVSRVGTAMTCRSVCNRRPIRLHQVRLPQPSITPTHSHSLDIV